MQGWGSHCSCQVTSGRPLEVPAVGRLAWDAESRHAADGAPEFVLALLPGSAPWRVSSAVCPSGISCRALRRPGTRTPSWSEENRGQKGQQREAGGSLGKAVALGQALKRQAGSWPWRWWGPGAQRARERRGPEGLGPPGAPAVGEEPGQGVWGRGLGPRGRART